MANTATSKRSLRQFTLSSHHLRRSVLLWLVFVVFIVLTLLPVYWIVLSSVTTRDALFRLPIRYWPKAPTLDNFRGLVDNIPYWRYLLNSMVFSILTAVVSVFLGFLAAYGFSRIRVPGSNIIFVGFLISTALPPISTLLPLFDLFRTFGLVDTRAGLIVLMSSMVVPFTVWILTTFIQQVPVAIEESAIVDGCPRWRIIFQIVAPAVMPALGPMVLVNFIIAWNELLIPLVFAVSKGTKTLTVGITELAIQSTAYSKPWELISAMGVTMIIPVVLLVLFFQRSLVRGLTQGSIK